MAGRPGRSGGHNKITLADHLQRGTYNPSRHGPRPPGITPAAKRHPGPVPDRVTIGLSGRGLAFVTDVFGSYGGWNPQSLELLREAGFLLTQLEEVRGTSGERTTQKLLLSVLAALRLED